MYIKWWLQCEGRMRVEWMWSLLLACRPVTARIQKSDQNQIGTDQQKYSDDKSKYIAVNK